jgi:FtsP/CotA-like multicopper oxidase with cupredoxin domain
LHLHRHLFECGYERNAHFGIKDNVVVLPWTSIGGSVGRSAGPTLFHCHIQHHMDFGFKALFEYA